MDTFYPAQRSYIGAHLIHLLYTIKCHLQFPFLDVLLRYMLATMDAGLLLSVF